MAEVNGKVVTVPDWDQYFLGIAEAVSGGLARGAGWIMARCRHSPTTTCPVPPGSA